MDFEQARALLEESVRVGTVSKATTRRDARAAAARLNESGAYSAFLILVQRGNRPRDGRVLALARDLERAQVDYYEGHQARVAKRRAQEAEWKRQREE